MIRHAGGPGLELIDALIADGLLEVVDQHARKTLVEPVERCLSGPSPKEAAARVLTVLEDAPEVVEIYADDAEMEALVARVRP